MIWTAVSLRRPDGDHTHHLHAVFDLSASKSKQVSIPSPFHLSRVPRFLLWPFNSRLYHLLSLPSEPLSNLFAKNRASRHSTGSLLNSCSQRVYNRPVQRAADGEQQRFHQHRLRSCGYAASEGARGAVPSHHAAKGYHAAVGPQRRHQ